ncbi:MAG: type II CAAX endopeptidase family protein [Acidobacteriota bacterium]
MLNVAGLRADVDRRRTALPPFLVYVVAFHVLWIAWPLVLYPRLQSVGDRTLTYALLNLSFRVLFWIAPVFAYLRYVDGVNPLDSLKLRGQVGRGIIVAIVLTVVNAAGTFARFGLPHPSLHRVTWNSIMGTSLLVGFIEDIPYRGFMLQKFGERMNAWLANLITSLLFLSIHLPGWIALRTFNAGAAASVFVLGVIFAAAVKYSDSLWASIRAHSANDCLSFVIFGL